MLVNVDIDIEKFRLALVGNGYTFAEVKNMSGDRLIEIFADKVRRTIESEYESGLRLGLYEKD